MRLVSGSIIFPCFIMLFMLPLPAHALPAITCHCFTNRAYDSAHPAAADEYFLATTQNSLFATVFNTGKETIVMKKQQGASSDDLWIAYWVASKTGTTPDSLLQAKLKTHAWKNAISTLRLSQKILGTRFSNALSTNISTVRLSETVVDELFRKERLLSEGDLSAVRKAGASNQELIMATVTAARTRQPASQLYLEVKTGAQTWGSLLTAARIDTQDMQQEVARMLKSHRQ